MDVRRAIRFLGALAFLPVELVPRTFRVLVDRLQDSGLLHSYPNMEQVYLYFATIYIGRNDELGRAIPPTFPIVGWNQFNRIIDQLPRSDASIEGFHSKAVAILGKHSAIGPFIDRLIVNIVFKFNNLNI